MLIKSLEVFGLRNLEPQHLEFTENINLFLGENGQGKTSILEAIFLLSHAKSFRTPTLKNILREDYSEKDGNVKAVVGTELGEITLEVKVRSSKRELFLNDKRVNGAEGFIGNLKTVLFTPDDLELVKGAPQVRRQFLDRTLVMIDRSYTKTLIDYTKVLKMRNSLLHSERFSEADIFLDQLIRLNLEISNKRVNLINDIREHIERSYLDISGSSDESLSLEYKSNFSKVNFSETEFRELFLSNLERDRVNRRTSIGVHKDDIKINFKSHTADGLSRELSSQGQARTIALSFKLGAFYLIKSITKDSPVLLFDDFEGELDEGRSRAFYKTLKEINAQTFLTTTHDKLNVGSGVLVRKVRQGLVE